MKSCESTSIDCSPSHDGSETVSNEWKARLRRSGLVGQARHQLREGLPSRQTGVFSGWEKNIRSLDRFPLAGAIDFPPPWLRRRGAVLHHDRIVVQIEICVHAKLCTGSAAKASADLNRALRRFCLQRAAGERSVRPLVLGKQIIGQRSKAESLVELSCRGRIHAESPSLQFQERGLSPRQFPMRARAEDCAAQSCLGNGQQAALQELQEIE
jgi:hypothetical protein